MKRLIQWSIDHHWMVLGLSVLLFAAGAWTAWRMPVDVFPDLTAPTVTILTEGHGMAPDEVIRAVTAGNVIMPSGSVNVDDATRISPINSVVGTINDLLDLPIRTGAGPPVSDRKSVV